MATPEEEGQSAPPNSSSSAAQAVLLGNADLITSLALLLVDDALSLARFGAVCTTWRDVLRDDEVVGKVLVRRRFGDQAAEAELPAAEAPGGVFGPWFRRFLQLARTHVNELSDPTTSGVVWGNTSQYWRQVSKPGGRALKVMELRMVCWFECSSVWKGVTQGTYKVVWRVQLGPPNQLRSFVTLKFDAQVEGARFVETGADVPSSHPAAPPAAGTVPHVNNNEAQHNACYAPLRVVRGAGAGAAASGAASSSAAGGEEGAPSGGALPRLELAAPAPPPEVNLGVRPVGLFLSRLEQNQLVELAGAAHAVQPGAWLDLEVGTFTVPPGVAMDVRTRLYDTTGAWKQGLSLDTVSLVPVHANAGDALADKAAAALDQQPAPAQQQADGAQRQGSGFAGMVLGAMGGLAARFTRVLSPRAVPGPMPPPPHPEEQ